MEFTVTPRSGSARQKLKIKEASMAIQLQQVAYHFVDKAANNLVYSENVVEIERLDGTVLDFLEYLTDKLWEAEDSGNTVSGNFN